MATITPTLYATIDGRTRIYTWEQINQDDEGGPIKIDPEYADKTLIGHGTFDTGSYALEVSVDGANYVPAVDGNGDAVVVAAAAAAAIVGSNGLYYRISNSNGGTTEDMDFFLVCVRS